MSESRQQPSATLDRDPQIALERGRGLVSRAGRVLAFAGASLLVGLVLVPLLDAQPSAGAALAGVMLTGALVCQVASQTRDDSAPDAEGTLAQAPLPLSGDDARRTKREGRPAALGPRAQWRLL